MTDYKPCPDCSGDGWVTINEEIRSGLFVESSDNCETCDGSGTLEIEPDQDDDELHIQWLIDMEDDEP